MTNSANSGQRRTAVWSTAAHTAITSDDLSAKKGLSIDLVRQVSGRSLKRCDCRDMHDSKKGC